MAEQIWSDVTNEEMDLDLLEEEFLDDEVDLDWKVETLEILAEFIAEVTEEDPNSGKASLAADLIREHYKEFGANNLIYLRKKQVNNDEQGFDSWLGIMLEEAFGEEFDIRWDLVRGMWEVEWFNNDYTHGCYQEGDFWADTEGLSTESLDELRALLWEGADKAAYDEWVDKNF